MRSDEQREHDNKMSRIRYAADRKTKTVRKEYASMSRKEKTKFSKTYDEATDLDDIQSYKQKCSTDRKRAGAFGIFKSRDQMMHDMGWRPEIALLNFGLRLEAKVDAQIQWCEKWAEVSGSGHTN